LKCSEKSVNNRHCASNAGDILVKNQAEVLLLPDVEAVLPADVGDEPGLAEAPPEEALPPRKSVTYHPVPFN